MRPRWVTARVAVLVLAASLIGSVAASAATSWTTRPITYTGSGTPAADTSWDQVSCTTKLCVGVGIYSDSAKWYLEVESLSHGAWTEQALTTTPLSDTYRPSVSCQGKTCVVVQGDTAWTDAGGQWTTSPLPGPSGVDTLEGYDGVSCVSTRWCVAVGSFSDGNDAVVDTFSDGEWSTQTIPVTSGSGSGLEGVDCISTTSCVAVGSGTGPDGNAGNGLESEVAELSGSTWSAAVLPPAAGATYGGLNAVSCPAAGACTAVGAWYPMDGGIGYPLTATLTGGDWDQGAGTGPNGDNAIFESVGCVSISVCYAGEAVISGSSDSPALQALGGGPVALSLPSGATAVGPQTVWCATSGWCTVAGYYDAPAGGTTASYPMVAESGAPSIAFTSAAKATAVVGKPFSFEVQTTSKPSDAITANGLPNGFTLTGSGGDTATISGVATAAEVGSDTVTLDASNGVAPAASQTFTLKVKS